MKRFLLMKNNHLKIFQETKPQITTPQPIPKIMKHISIYLLAIFILTSCNRTKTAKDPKTEAGFATEDLGLAKDPTEKFDLDCSRFNFKNMSEQTEALLKYVDKNTPGTDEEFFCAFPNSFQEMLNLFGYDLDKGAAPLYSNGAPIINYFANLNTIAKNIYYDKYINICVNGTWDADNIREAFGFADRLKNDTKAAALALSLRSDSEIKSVFKFVFDGPHPENEFNENLFNELMHALTNQDPRLTNLLETAYNQVLTEYDGH